MIRSFAFTTRAGWALATALLFLLFSPGLKAAEARQPKNTLSLTTL
jgi:hypothetical protein